ncbi:porin family protein [Saccharicrinis aurantiacus]|uniref:porin family protein n=1 Tax=Saccharicrinis aurantiacus TaxID=1849719 RepID=UPI002491723F|nr:porin family protein [Saccharicrinis aurantiacus]
MKNFLLIISVLLIAANANAQEAFSFGVKGGASFFNYDTEFLNKHDNPNISNYEQETLPGYNIGVFAKIFLTGPLYFQPEVYYSQKSMKETITVVEGSIPLKFAKNDVMHFVDVPLLLNATIFDFTFAGKIYGMAGPNFSFLTSSKETYGTNFGTTSNPNTEDLIKDATENDFKTLNYTLQAGLGYEIRKFHVDFRYERGLMNMSEENFDMTLNNFMIGIGLRFM